MIKDKNYYKNEILNRFNIEWLESKIPYNSNTSLLVTRCSGTKNPKVQDIYYPKELYYGLVPQLFFKKMDIEKLRYGVLSDLHGIVWDDEQIKNYDMPPQEVDDEGFKKLGEVIHNKVKERYPNITQIFFYNTSVIMSYPYFKMLNACGYKSYYFSNLDLLDFRKRLF